MKLNMNNSLAAIGQRQANVAAVMAVAGNAVNELIDLQAHAADKRNAKQDAETAINAVKGTTWQLVRDVMEAVTESVAREDRVQTLIDTLEPLLVRQKVGDKLVPMNTVQTYVSTGVTIMERLICQNKRSMKDVQEASYEDARKWLKDAVELALQERLQEAAKLLRYVIKNRKHVADIDAVMTELEAFASEVHGPVRAIMDSKGRAVQADKEIRDNRQQGITVPTTVEVVAADIVADETEELPEAREANG